MNLLRILAIGFLTVVSLAALVPQLITRDSYATQFREVGETA